MFTLTKFVSYVDLIIPGGRGWGASVTYCRNGQVSGRAPRNSDGTRTPLELTPNKIGKFTGHTDEIYSHRLKF